LPGLSAEKGCEMARVVKAAQVAGEYAPGWPPLEKLARHTHHWLRDPSGLGPVPHWFIGPGFHGEMTQGAFAKRGYEYCGPCKMPAKLKATP
jgi:hypothetical protein